MMPRERKSTKTIVIWVVLALLAGLAFEFFVWPHVDNAIWGG